MARRTAKYRAYLKQRRQGVAEIRHRQMLYEAQGRARGIGLVRTVRIAKDVFDICPDDILSSFANLRRKLLGLGECSVESSREQILARLNKMADCTEVVYRLGDPEQKALFLIRTEDKYFYFIYRERGKYYKKSAFYPTRTAAMERYNNKYPGILWVKIVHETHG